MVHNLSVLHLPLLEHSTLTSLVYKLLCTHVCEQNKTLSKVNYIGSRGWLSVVRESHGSKLSASSTVY